MGQSIEGIYQSPKQIDSAQKARIKELETVNIELLEAIKVMCDYHENMATWDKGNNGYYKAKRLISAETKNSKRQ